MMTTLPIEMLQSIFGHLVGQDLLRCRAVCRAWRAAIDDLPEVAWQEICLRQSHLGDYAAARKKYGLSWRDTYRALNSWSAVDSAEIKIELLNISARRFKVLPNGTIALLRCRVTYAFDYYDMYADTIVYYNIETLQELATDEFEFRFVLRQIEINEHFIVLIHEDSRICLVSRANKRRFFVGKTNGFTIKDGEVYFKNKDDDLVYVCKFVEEDGECSVKRESLGGLTRGVAEFNIKGCNVNALTREEIFVYNKEKKVFDYVKDFKINTELFKTIEEYCFDWKRISLFYWRLYSNLKNHSNISSGQVYVHAGLGTGMSIIIVLDSSLNAVNIHHCKFPISMTELETTLKSDPTRRIELADELTEQVDIVETSSSHKILVLGHRKLHVYEFVFNAFVEKQHQTEKMKRPSAKTVSTKGKMSKSMSQAV